MLSAAPSLLDQGALVRKARFPRETLDELDRQRANCTTLPDASSTPDQPAQLSPGCDENHHLWSKARIGEMLPDGQFKVVAESPELIKPDPFPKGYQ